MIATETGLMLTPRTTEDAYTIGKAIEESGYYAEYDVRNGYFFFQEEQDNYDSLEQEIDEMLSEYEVGYRIEGIF